MSELDIVRILARAESGFATLRLDCTAEYDVARLDPAQRNAASPVRSTERFRHIWRVWWRRPDCWRDDIIYEAGQTASTVICGGVSTAHLSGFPESPARHLPRGFLAKLGAVFRRREFTSTEALEERVPRMPLVWPRGLSTGWSLDSLGPGEQASRPTLRVRAVRGPNAAEFGQWPYVDEYVVDVDEERGILLRCAAVVGGSEASALTARAVQFDEPIPDEVFASART